MSNEEPSFCFGVSLTRAQRLGVALAGNLYGPIG